VPPVVPPWVMGCAARAADWLQKPPSGIMSMLWYKVRARVCFATALGELCCALAIDTNGNCKTIAAASVSGNILAGCVMGHPSYVPR